MRVPLEKTEYLFQLEAVLKKYGYDTMYCEGGFTGKKESNLWFHINGEATNTIHVEISKVIDPSWFAEYATPEDCSGIFIEHYTDEDVARWGEPVYVGGEFYGN